MNLDFGILWIEDSYSHEEVESLKRRVQDSGFIAQIKNIPNSTGIEDLAREHSLYHHYDIILLDYRLKDENGNTAALKIRTLFPSTTILFYSGSAAEQNLREMIAQERVEGVYCSARQRFITRAGELIDQTAHALDRLSGMRGLAMKVVSECDDLMKTATLSLHKHNQDYSKQIAELDKDGRIQLASATPSRLNEKARWYSTLASPSNQRLRGVWAMHTLPGKNGTTSARQ